jgi:hydrophobe/amphiphile efflux-1 (HAE1) family protein
MRGFNFSAWSIRYPTPSIVLFAILGILGLISFHAISITRFPNIDVPLINVTIVQNGAAPSELETQVTKRVEDAVSAISGIKNIVSTITDGQSATAIEFQLEVNADHALNDVKDAIARIRSELPRTINEPIIQSIDVAGTSILTYAVTAPAMTLEQLSWHVDDTLIRAVQGIRGVGRVERYGGVKREVRISLNADRLLSLGVTAAEVNRQLRSTNINLAGGRGEVGGQEQAIRTLASAPAVESLRQTKIALPGGRDTRLDQLGDVIDTYEEPRSFARLNGQPVVAFGVFRAKGTSDVDVKQAVEKKLQDLRAANPNVGIRLIDDTVRYTYGNYLSAMETLIEGAILAIIVVFLFLRDWRATIISSIALPLAIIPTFWAIDAINFSLNLVSLLALTLVTGILVDDAIVEIENIVRHMHMGKSPYHAAMEAADEIGLAVIAITLTIAAVFAPVSFMGGIAGQYFKQFGLTVAIAVLFSLLVARLITPMMAAYLMRPLKESYVREHWLIRSYTHFLNFTLRHPYRTMLAGAALLVVSILATGLLPTGFVPPVDASRTVLSIEIPPGSTLEDTRRTTDEIATRVSKFAEVSGVLVLGGVSATGTVELGRATVIVSLTPKKQRALSQRQVESKIAGVLSDISDIRYFTVNDRGEREFAIGIVSANPEALNLGVAKMETVLRHEKGFRNASAMAALDRPEIRITPRLDVAAELGVPPDAISETLRVATIGDIPANLAQFDAGDRQVPIRVQLNESARANLTLLSALSVRTARGGVVPLASVADISFGQGPSTIDRFNRVRRVVIGAELTDGMQLGEALTRVKEIAKTQLPPGVNLAETGDAQIMSEVFQGFADAMGAGMMMVFAVLILLFGSVFHPITILLSLPLSISGVIIALLATQNPVSMPVVIGILMLMGIVTKNAIMLVDFAVEQEKRGLTTREAIVDAGRKRARPIIMTTIAMTAGMFPTALGLGDGGEFRSPMAIAVIGGLLVSTVLSLIFVPSFFIVMDEASHKVGKFLGKFIGPREEESPV